MSNEVVNKNKTDITVQDMAADWCEKPELSANDLVIPKILAMQGLSNFVTEGKAKFGDFVNSITGEVLGDMSKPLEFIPFYMTKYWAISKKVNGKFEFNSIEPCNTNNENLPWEFQVDGVEHTRQLNRAFYVLVEGQPLPLILSFKGMSSNAGKILATQMYTINSVKKIPPPGMTMELHGRKQQNDKGTFIVLDVRVKGETPKEKVAECLNWFRTIKSTQVRHDNSDLETGF